MRKISQDAPRFVCRESRRRAQGGRKMGFPTFRGGVHPPQNKDLTRDKAIEDYKPKGELVFPMSQHIGAPNAPAVKKGDRVLVGTVLGSTEAFVSAPILSSVSGTVKDIGPRRVTAGNFDTCVVVENDGLYERDPKWAPIPDYENCDPKEYVRRLREAGIVGFGGATFPAAVKFAPRDPSKIKWLIANGAECEPYLNCDFRLMLEATEEIVQGMSLLLRLFPNAEGVIAVENNKPEAIAALSECVSRLGVVRVRVQPMTVKYPQGAEKMLIEALTGQEYVVTALPADVGCIIANVRTVQQAYRAIAFGEPAVERVITVTGDAIAEPKNVRVPLGTSIAELVEFCGGFATPPAKVLSGGPMMGVAMRTLDVPAVKGSSGLLCLTAKSTMLARPSACLRCGRCVDACPVGLVPSDLDSYVLLKRYDDFEKQGGMNCIECGSCTYVCPACRPLTQSCRDGKTYVMAQRRKAAVKK